jgi:hypothetical protein
VIRRCPAPLTALAAALLLVWGLQPISAMADGISSSDGPGTADYTLTATTGLPNPTVPVPGTVFTQLGTITSGSNAVMATSTSELAPGDVVSGTGIPSGDTISTINANGSGFTLSQNATGSGPQSLTFTSVPSPQIGAIIDPAGGVVTPATSSTQGPLTILPGSHGFSTSGVFDFLANGTNPTTGQPEQALGLSFYGQGLAAGGVLNFSLNVANASNPPQLQSQTSGVTITLDPPSSSTSSSSSSSSTSSSSSSSSSSENADSVPEPLSLLLWSVLAGAGLLRVRALRRSGQGHVRQLS